MCIFSRVGSNDGGYMIRSLLRNAQTVKYRNRFTIRLRSVCQHLLACKHANSWVKSTVHRGQLNRINVLGSP